MDDLNKRIKQLEAELERVKGERDEAENRGADLFLYELHRRGINTDNWDGDEGLWPTLARCVASRIQEAEQRATTLEAALEKARENEGRYLWLRSHRQQEGKWPVLVESNLDAAIDAARTK